MQNILDMVLEYAEENNAGKVTKINLVIGELSGFVPEWMHTYFDHVSAGTIAHKAEVNIELVPALIKCGLCGKEFKLTKEKMELYCPECECARVEIISGKECSLKSIEID